MSVAVLHNSHHHIFGWKSYQLLKKKAMAQELSWTGLILNLSIVFFIVIGCAFLLNAAYQSVHSPSPVAPMEQRIEMASLARAIFTIDTAQAAASDYIATPKAGNNSIRLTQGQQVTDSITYTNSGTKSWRPVDVTFETGPFMRTGSKFSTSNWVDFYRPAKLTKEVKPGQSVTFSFGLKAPFDFSGTSQEDFQLVINGKSMEGSRVRHSVTVKPASVVSPASPATATAKARPAPKAEKPSGTARSKADVCIASVSASEYQDCNSDRNGRSDDHGIITNRILNSEPTMRVGLFSTTAAQRLTVNRAFSIYGGDELLAEGLKSGTVVTISYDSKSKQYAIVSSAYTGYTRKPVRIVAGSSGVVTILDYRAGQKPQDNAFRRIVEYRYVDTDKAVWLINELPLDDYIKGLGETTNASPVEFQKVMATVSRTYALYHYLRGVNNNIPDGSTKHAAQHFHVDSVYDQVYRGYNSELRLTGLTEAVEATRGLIITYKDAPIVAAYFSNSDGRTRSYKEVWGGDGLPYLVSVPVPEDKGKTLNGHGVGMSARGALLMVSNGTPWQDAVTYFYTGTVIERMY